MKQKLSDALGPCRDGELDNTGRDVAGNGDEDVAANGGGDVIGNGDVAGDEDVASSGDGDGDVAGDEDIASGTDGDGDGEDWATEVSSCDPEAKVTTLEGKDLFRVGNISNSSKLPSNTVSSGRVKLG